MKGALYLNTGSTPTEDSEAVAKSYVNSVIKYIHISKDGNYLGVFVGTIEDFDPNKCIAFAIGTNNMKLLVPITFDAEVPLDGSGGVRRIKIDKNGNIYVYASGNAMTTVETTIFLFPAAQLEI